MLQASIAFKPGTSPTTTTTTGIKTGTNRVAAAVAAGATAMPAPTTSPTQFTCTADGCRGMNDVDLLFRALQNLINLANQKLVSQKIAAGAPIAVNGFIDNATVQAYLPISRAVGGTLAIFDFKPDPKFLATNAKDIALTLMRWAGYTWVNEANGVPGHWERLRAGQTPTLPTVPLTPGGDPLVISPLPEATKPPVPVPSPTPTPPPPPPPPPTVMTMYICPDGTRVSSPEGCPLPAPTPVTPTAPPPIQTSIPTQPVITPTPSPSSLRYAGCIARYNRTRKVYAIYCPNTSTALGLANEQFRCLHGNCLGEAETPAVTPPPPTGMTKVAETTALPNEGETPGGDERDKFFRLGNPLMWLSFAGAAAAIGGGGYAIYRRKRRAA